MGSRKMIQMLEQRIDQGTMELRKMLERLGGPDAETGLMRMFAEMACSEDQTESVTGILAGFGLAVAMRDREAAELRAEEGGR